ncbi:hypothetical protein [Succinimonas sp.]|uniref:hypothetical protein n=1 Tax=Succinimonas sp. TaxID=1936151 RepID=UPI00386A77A0
MNNWDERYETEKARKRFLGLNREQFNAMTGQDFFRDYFPLKSRFYRAEGYTLPGDADPETAERLNDYIRSFYDPKFMRGAGYTDLYMAMQHFSEDDAFSRRGRSEKELQKMFGKENYPQWQCFINDASYFLYFQFQRPGEYDEYGNERYYSAASKVKAYLTFRDDVSLEDFLAIVRYLADNCEEQFSAKIAKKRRIDHMCFWLSVRDFRLLEQYVAACEEKFVRAMPFVPYIGKIGITLELITAPESYNEGISLLLFAYVNSVKSREEMNVRDMYDRLIRMGDRCDDCGFPGCEGTFEHGDGAIGAKILLLESADLVLRNKDPDKDCFIFRAARNSKEWRAIRDAWNWAGVRDDYRYELKN